MGETSTNRHPTINGSAPTAYIEHLDFGGDGSSYEYYDDYDIEETIYLLKTVWNTRVYPLSGIVALIVVAAWALLVVPGVLTEQHRRRVRRCQMIVVFSVWSLVFGLLHNLPFISSSFVSTRSLCAGAEAAKLALAPVGPTVLATLWITRLVGHAKNTDSSRVVTVAFLTFPWLFWLAVMIPFLLITKREPLPGDGPCDSPRDVKHTIIIYVITCIIPAVVLLSLVVAESIVLCCCKKPLAQRRPLFKKCNVLSDILVSVFFVTFTTPWQIYGLVESICIYFQNNHNPLALFDKLCSYDQGAQSKFNYASLFLVMAIIGLPVAELMWLLSRDIRRSICRTARFRCLCRKVPRRDTYCDRRSTEQSVRLCDSRSH